MIPTKTSAGLAVTAVLLVGCGFGRSEETVNADEVDPIVWTAPTYPALGDEEMAAARAAREAELAKGPDAGEPPPIVGPAAIFPFEEVEPDQSTPGWTTFVAELEAAIPVAVAGGWCLTVTAFTDDVGTPEFNAAFSGFRASAVEEKIEARFPDLDPGCVTPVGGGIAGSGATARRVEIDFTDSTIQEA